MVVGGDRGLERLPGEGRGLPGLHFIAKPWREVKGGSWEGWGHEAVAGGGGGPRPQTGKSRAAQACGTFHDGHGHKGPGWGCVGCWGQLSPWQVTF